MFGPPTKKTRKKASKVVAATSPPSVNLEEPAYITVPDDSSRFAPTSVQSGPDSIQMTEGRSLPTTPVRISPKFPPPFSPAPKFGVSPEGFAPAPTWDGTNLEPPPGLSDCGTLTGSKADSQKGLEPGELTWFTDGYVQDQASALLLMQPPGLDQVAEAPPASTPVASTTPSKEAGLSTVLTDVDGKECVRAEWHIAGFAKKVREFAGRALVSPKFCMSCLSPNSELPNLQLNVQMIDNAELNALRGKTKRTVLAKLMKDGELRFQLALKMTSSVPAGKTVAPITFFLTLGGKVKRQRKGESVNNVSDFPIPFTEDFSDSPMRTCNVFETDWLELMDKEGGLTVGLEILVNPP